MTVCQQMEIKCLGEGACLLYKSTIWAISALVPSPCCPQVYELLMPEDLPQSPHVDPWKIVQGPWLWCAPPPSGSTPGGQQIPGPTPFLAERPALALLLPFTEPLCIPTTTLPRPVPLHRHSQGPPSHMHFFSVLDFLLLPPSLPFFLPLFRKKKSMCIYCVPGPISNANLTTFLPCSGPSEFIPVLWDLNPAPFKAHLPSLSNSSIQ